MKKFFFSLMLCAVMTTMSFAQEPVKDSGKWSVLNNMEFMERVRLQPEWYHYWIWYKKIFGIKIPLPGLGLHDSYAKEDRRNILQETPAMAAVAFNRQQAEKEHESVDTMYRQELFKFTDKSVDYQYTLTKSRRNDLLSDITAQLTDYIDNGGDVDKAKVISDEVLRISSNVEIIHDSHMSNAKKREAYLDYEKELVEVLSLVTRMNNLNKNVRNYERVN